MQRALLVPSIPKVLAHRMVGVVRQMAARGPLPASWSLPLISAARAA